MNSPEEEDQPSRTNVVPQRGSSPFELFIWKTIKKGNLTKGVGFFQSNSSRKTKETVPDLYPPNHNHQCAPVRLGSTGEDLPDWFTTDFRFRIWGFEHTIKLTAKMPEKQRGRGHSKKHLHTQQLFLLAGLEHASTSVTPNHQLLRIKLFFCMALPPGPFPWPFCRLLLKLACSCLCL